MRRLLAVLFLVATAAAAQDISLPYVGYYQIFLNNGVEVPQRVKLNVVGCSFTDNGVDTTTLTCSGGGGGGAPGGSPNSIQYDNAGAFGGLLNSSSTKGYLYQTNSGAPVFQLVPIPAADLPAAAVYNNQANTYSGSGLQDFAAVPTRPNAGASLPGTCAVGQVFFLTSAGAGANWYGCTSLNTWTVMSGGSAQAATYQSVASASSLSVSCNSNTGNSILVTLNGNVSSSTFGSCSAGSFGTLNIIESSPGGYAFTPPANYVGFGSLNGTSGCTYHQVFYYDGTNFNGVNAGYSTGTCGASALVLPGSTSGQQTVSAQAIAGSLANTLPAANGTIPSYASAGTSGNCVQWLTNGALGDAGAACGSGGSGTFSPLPPYFSNGTNKYVAATGYQATLPSFSGWSGLNSVALTGSSTGANGDVTLMQGSTAIFYGTIANTSIEAEYTFAGSSNNAAADQELWAWDGSSFLLTCGVYQGYNVSATQYGSAILNVAQYSYSGSGAPSFTSGNFQGALSAPVAHIKMVKSGSTLNCQVSNDGGATYVTFYSHAITAIANVGVSLQNTNANFLSLVTH